MRRPLDWLYRASAVLAALSLLGIFLAMMAQVVLREMGRQFPGADDLVAYLTVATSFFALAWTFKRGELIRVGLFVEKLPPGPRRWLEALVLALAVVLTATIAWFTFADAMFSREIEEVAQGTVPFPIWVPKLAMPLGAGILCLAVAEELVAVLRGRTPAYVEAAEERTARGDFSAEV